MRQAPVTSTFIQPGSLERFIGPEASILSSSKVEISQSIIAEIIEVQTPHEQRPEDQGALYLFPIEDARFCLQLCYLQYTTDSSDKATVYSIKYLPGFFDQYPPETLMANQPFRFDQSTEQQFPVCTQSRTLLEQLQQGTALTPFLHSLQLTEIATHLLRRSLECITVPFTSCQVPACRFLAYESERDKIHMALQLIDQHIDQPFTIRDLARKVAMNECYLKKGFKTVTGKTIHEYQQERRINRARQLLQQQGHTVTDVANILGYSSISHFSTAFKRVTGMKPCELLA